MDQETGMSQDQKDIAFIQRKLKLEHQFKNGTSWFYWIGALSFLNSFVFLLGGSLNFVIGLVGTQFIDGVMAAVAEESGATAGMIAKGIGFGLDAIIIGAFIAFGYFSRKKIKWVYILGMVLYAIDTIILIAFKELFMALFHFFALGGLFRGYLVINEINKLDVDIPAGPGEVQ